MRTLRQHKSGYFGALLKKLWLDYGIKYVNFLHLHLRHQINQNMTTAIICSTIIRMSNCEINF